MPGEILAFTCTCGFQADDVYVGATITGEVYWVGMCLSCRRLVSFLQRAAGRRGRIPQPPPLCFGCRAPLLSITAPGAWGPAAVQAAYPDEEPWLVVDRIAQSGAPIGVSGGPEQIRIRCPRCRRTTLRFEAQAIWD